MSPKTVIGCIIFCLSLPLSGRQKLPYIRFHTEVAWSTILNMQMYQIYQGEFYPEGQLPVVLWSEVDDRRKLVPGYGYWNISGHFGTSFQNGLYVGMRYNIMQLKGLKTPGLSAGPFLDINSSFFFLYSLQAGYIWQPLKQHPQWSVIPLAGAGSYFSNEYFSGNGRKWMVHTQVKTSYLFRGRYGLFISPGYAVWQHREKGYSSIFERKTLDRILLQQWYMEAGFSFRIHIDRTDR